MQNKTKIILLSMSIALIISIAIVVSIILVGKNSEKDIYPIPDYPKSLASENNIFVAEQTYQGVVGQQIEFLPEIYCNKRTCTNITVSISCLEDINLTPTSQPTFTVNAGETGRIGALYIASTPGTSLCTLTAEGEGFSASKTVKVIIME